jgi:transposase-like protein
LGPDSGRKQQDTDDIQRVLKEMISDVLQEALDAALGHNQLYGVEVSPTLISNVTNKIMPVVKEWQNRPLQSYTPWYFWMPFISRSNRTDRF